MPTSFRTPRVTQTPTPTAELETELLVVPVFEDDDLADEPSLDAAAGGEIARARARREMTGKLFEQVVVGRGSGRTLLVGAGPRSRCTSDTLRRIAVVGGLAARARRLTRIAVLVRDGLPVAAAEAVQAIAEGVHLANFEPAALKTGEPARGFLEHAVVRVADGPEVVAALERGCVLGESTNVARELANLPGNLLTPALFADRAAAVATAAGLAVEILDESRIAELGMGLLQGVARGSAEPARVVVLRYEPPSAPQDVVLGLVGKGITFDTGGISIKPADNMDKMKDDMSGGAAVIAAMAALARLRAPVRCVGVVPMTENMPGGRAVKPGDVLTSAEGKTVEIINTDAEGRLILGDGLWYARRLGATHLVDIATLTGAVVVALGKTTSGLFGAPAEWVSQVHAASERAGDRSWPMPIFPDYKEQLRSEIADFTNTGGRPGGSITAALFLEEFSGDLPWVHVDIAGTAWAEEAKPYQPKGPTGVGVRTLVELGLNVDAWAKLALTR